ncbi:MAG: hypothetical protein IJI27_05550 [Oscillospiraceae bacterium]|nr:hypothetical protein [Oscillospiraceae bacterium]
MTEEAKELGADEELTEETGITGSGLALQLPNGRTELLRDTAMSGLLNAGKIDGKWQSYVTKPEFCLIMNTIFPHIRTKRLVLERWGKVSAIHSQADGGYEIIPISAALEIAVDALRKRFGKLVFTSGYNSHSRTEAVWELPDAQSALCQKYQDALDGTMSQVPVNFMPVVRFRSSDTANSAVTLVPGFRKPGDKAIISFVPGARTEHTKGGKEEDVSGLDLFREDAGMIYSQFEKSMEKIAALKDIEIKHGCNAVIGLAKKLVISRKYAEAARSTMEMFTGGDIGNPVTGHDLYLAMTECISEAVRSGASQKTIMDTEEKVYRMLKFDLTEYDKGGVVAW